MFVRRLVILLTLLISFLCSGCQQGTLSSKPVASATPSAAPPLSEPPAVSVPQGTAPAIDGIMTPGEWENARAEPFGDGSQLLLMYDAGALYLGIRANTPEMIVGNVFLHSGDEIAILHASAALGTALYGRGEGSWQRVQDFTWRCRATDNSETAKAERDAFL